MYKIKNILLSFSWIIFSSCLSTIASVGGLKDKSPDVKRLNIEGKEVYFIGMSHLAKEEFYLNTKKIITEYQQNGFMFYVETVKNDKEDTLALKKFRKLMNLDLKIKFSNIDNSILVKLKDKYKLIDQPKYEYMGLTSYKIVDYNYSELLDFYEKKYGKIILDSCDLKTEIGSKYICTPYESKDRKVFKNEIIIKKRNELIVEKIKNSEDKKIVIIFGKKHLKGITELLKH